VTSSGASILVANLVMATVLLHMGRVFASGATSTAWANWLIGLGLIAITLRLIFGTRSSN
jgi:hypothetical protein